MLNLDRQKNDTSLSLDLLRAVAAQMVCFGHALNLTRGVDATAAPSWGVLIFFILSGFLIAFTLATKSRSPDYGLLRYAIERTSRIYCAYLPAMFLLLAIELGIRHFNLGPVGIADWRTFLGNLAMLQLYPGAPFGNFGASGQTTSIAVEFHIYFFVGGLWFLCLRRSPIAAMFVAIAASKLPIGYALALPGRALFVLWLAGFGLYFVLASIKLDRWLAAQICTVAGFTIYIAKGADFFAPSDPYSLSNFFPLSLGFACLVLVSQNTKVLHRAERLIRFLADYSLSLFLIHLVIITYFLRLFTEPGVIEALAAALLANVLAALFARFTERKYRIVAAWAYRSLRRESRPNLPHSPGSDVAPDRQIARCEARAGH